MPDSSPTSSEDIVAGLAAIVHEIAGTDPARVTPAASFSSDLDLDSLTMVEVVVAAEERFGVRIPDADIDQLRTVGDAVDYIQRVAVA
jgi:acyl carrier protein